MFANYAGSVGIAFDLDQADVEARGPARRSRDGLEPHR
jgi:hypothetical protein